MMWNMLLLVHTFNWPPVSVLLYKMAWTIAESTLLSIFDTIVHRTCAYKYYECSRALMIYEWFAVMRKIYLATYRALHRGIEHAKWKNIKSTDWRHAPHAEILSTGLFMSCGIFYGRAKIHLWLVYAMTIYCTVTISLLGLLSL